MARKPHKYNYLYKTTCTVNGKYYIGMHGTDILDDKYLGSGAKIRNSIRAHGRDAHKIEILEFFENREDLSNREREMVNEDLLKDPLCMNLVKGGEAKPLFDMEARSKGAINANKKNWKDPDFREKMRKNSASIMNKIWSDPEKSKKLLEGASKSFLGRIHSEETKQRIGEKSSLHQKGNNNSQFGTIWIFSHEERKNKRIKKSELDSYLVKAWNIGMNPLYLKKIPKNQIPTETIILIRSLFEDGKRIFEIEKETGINRITVSNIVKNKIFKNLQ